MMDADRLDDLLAERGWHRKDLAAAAGISPGSLSRAINTGCRPRPTTRAGIVRALGLHGTAATSLFDYKQGGTTP